METDFPVAIGDKTAGPGIVYDPDAFCDAIFLSRSERLQLYRPPIYVSEVHAGQVVRLMKQRDPFQFEDGRYPPLGDRITNAVAEEIRRHPLFNVRFIEYQAHDIPEKMAASAQVQAENERLREQLQAMQSREAEMARQLDEAYAKKGQVAPVPAPDRLPARQPTPPEVPTTSPEVPSSQETMPATVHVVEDITNKTDALDALRALGKPVDRLGPKPTKEQLLAFASEHGVSFPGY